MLSFPIQHPVSAPDTLVETAAAPLGTATTVTAFPCPSLPTDSPCASSPRAPSNVLPYEQAGR